MPDIRNSVSIEKEWDNLTTGGAFELTNPLGRDTGTTSLELSSFLDAQLKNGDSVSLTPSFSHKIERDDDSTEISTGFATKLAWKKSLQGRRHLLSLGSVFSYQETSEYEKEEDEETNYTQMGIGLEAIYRIQIWRVWANIFFYDSDGDEKSLQLRLRTRLNIDLVKIEFEYRYRHYFNDEDDKNQHELRSSIEFAWEASAWLQFSVGCSAFWKATKDKHGISPFIGMLLIPGEGITIGFKFFPLESDSTSPY